jgi:laminin, alpha 1/2
MSNLIRGSGKLNNVMSALITKLSNSDTRKSVEESSIVADEILEDMRVLSKETMEIEGDVENLNKRFQDLDPEWDSKYGMAQENADQALINIREANNTWNVHESSFRQQSEKFQKWNESFSLKLQELRDKIAQAKHAAEGVSRRKRWEIDTKFMAFRSRFAFRLSRPILTASGRISRKQWDRRLQTAS